MSEERNLLRSILELGEHTEFLAHWGWKAAEYFLLGPLVLGLIAAIWAAVKGSDPLWIAIAALASFAAMLFLIAAILFLINQVMRFRHRSHNPAPQDPILTISSTTSTTTSTPKKTTTTSSST